MNNFNGRRFFKSCQGNIAINVTFIFPPKRILSRCVLTDIMCFVYLTNARLNKTVDSRIFVLRLPHALRTRSNTCHEHCTRQYFNALATLNRKGKSDEIVKWIFEISRALHLNFIKYPVLSEFLERYECWEDSFDAHKTIVATFLVILRQTIRKIERAVLRHLHYRYWCVDRNRLESGC